MNAIFEEKMGAKRKTVTEHSSIASGHGDHSPFTMRKNILPHWCVSSVSCNGVSTKFIYNGIGMTIWVNWFKIT